ncbi:carboxylating nicotinate-nucleotide diphosphorylase [Paracoccus sp. Z330]|uniref:nicotinate-nucleotide diphosphorylase (carboxylating) n=1 Tax=Paracoccus onchidii TaxID=3017813 RepID=A0ABT4ZJS5_9RHOB|nr:carboxylating nicotinate-nucleotide diphosphorylase [Paracoccus onchidii]MDB6179312.1 carboxylating nicotinate-nucleotide diphosphorylase [Paracoccus onchidii]
MTTLPPLPDMILEPLVRAALLEDLGTNGDITTRTVIAAGTQYRARIVARQSGVVSGMQLARLAFGLVDPSLHVRILIDDGNSFAAGDELAVIEGEAASILSGERVALNFLGRLCGTATMTADFVARTEGFATRITCTRKTTPGLRLVEKQAVLHGGGFSHRFSLSDAILIKDNHIAAAGGIASVLQAVRERASHMMRVEIEVDDLDQLQQVLDQGGADVVLLDNMSTPMLTQAVTMNGGRLILEASGNMRLDRIAEVAATGVDYISSGALTHSVGTIDLGLDF